jgi:hypothetical protein
MEPELIEIGVGLPQQGIRQGIAQTEKSHIFDGFRAQLRYDLLDSIQAGSLRVSTAMQPHHFYRQGGVHCRQSGYIPGGRTTTVTKTVKLD